MALAEEEIVEKVIEKLEKLRRTRLTLGFPEVAQVLAEKNLIRYGGVTRSVRLSPGQIAVFEEKPPLGKVLLFTSVKVDLYPDEALAFAMFVDSDTPCMTDDAMVKSRYENMIYYWQMGMFLKCEQFLRVVVVNTSDTEPAFYSYLLVIGVMEKRIWDKIVSRYYEAIREEFGIT
jgi:hypothetical protein